MPDVDDLDFGLSLKEWHALYAIALARACKRLGNSYTVRLRAVNVARAQRIRAELLADIVKQEPTKSLVCRLSRGYTKLQTKWPDHIAVLEEATKARVQSILSTRQQRPSVVWSGDMEVMPNVADCTVGKLKEILRYFKQKFSSAENKILITGNKPELIDRVRALTVMYSSHLMT